MYPRHTTIRKAGQTHTYWRLVRSVRRGRRVTQETVAHLGEPARAIRSARRGTHGEPVTVPGDLLRLDRMWQFGDVWLGWRLWRALALDEQCGEALACGRERVPCATMAAIW
jgi:hypothetical protein